MIAILDYGVGNLFSLRSSLQQLGLQAVVTADADAIRAADRLILPGVGAFGDAMAKLTATGLVPVLKEQAEQKPKIGAKCFSECIQDGQNAEDLNPKLLIILQAMKQA